MRSVTICYVLTSPRESDSFSFILLAPEFSILFYQADRQTSVGVMGKGTVFCLLAYSVFFLKLIFLNSNSSHLFIFLPFADVYLPQFCLLAHYACQPIMLAVVVACSAHYALLALYACLLARYACLLGLLAHYACLLAHYAFLLGLLAHYACCCCC